MNEVQSICIIGAGESGVGAAHLAVRLGCEVFVTDAGFINQKYKEELISLGVSFEEGGHSIEKVLVTDLVIKSPGVPDDTPLLRSLYGGNRRVISEIEFGFMFYSGLTIAITGSNGKTTTAGLLYHVLKTGGLDVGLSGNYGISFCRMLAQAPPRYMVLEMSSFQLDQIETFAPYVGILLNITPDHLDR